MYYLLSFVNLYWSLRKVFSPHSGPAQELRDMYSKISKRGRRALIMIAALPVLFVVAFLSVTLPIYYANRTVTRILLAIRGVFPWRYQRLLDYSVDRILLRRVGNGYIFVHRLLLDHLADKYEEEQKAAQVPR
jgi:hypothetical protein